MPSNISEVEEPQSPVPPGNLTGLYYIIVAGLPWNTSWQSLKDFARKFPDGTKINVDHAMVYPGSTDGWVRIKGRREFQRALAHLASGQFHNRAIIADGRNEKEWTMLRALNLKKSIQSQPTSSSHGHRECLHTPPPSPVFWSMTHIPPPVRCMPFLLTHTMTPQMSSQASHAPISVSKMAPAQIPAHQILAIQMYQPQTSLFQMSAPQLHQSQLPPPQMSPQGHIEPCQYWTPTPVIHMVAKITIIKRLGTFVTEDSLKTLLRLALPHHNLEHLDIRIARNYFQVPKCYAFVTFPSVESARWAINALNNLPRDVCIFAGFAKEGIVPKRNYRRSRGEHEHMPISNHATSNCSFSSSSTGVTPSPVSENTEYTLCASPLQAGAIAPPLRSARTPMVVDGSSS